MSLAVIGATSVIGREIAKAFFRANHSLLLISRDTSGINPHDISEGFVVPRITRFDSDISCASNIEPMAEKIIDSFDDDPYVPLAVGTLGDAHSDHNEVSNLLEIMDVNLRNLAAVAMQVARELEGRKRGSLVFLSSVAGDRGRQSNYVYGASKAGLSVFAQGLRNELFRSRVHVLTVKLGYIDTPMFRQSLGSYSNKVPSFLVGNPEKVGQRIYQAAIEKRNVVYLGRIWWLIMFFVCNIPESIFKRLRL